MLSSVKLLFFFFFNKPFNLGELSPEKVFLEQKETQNDFLTSPLVYGLVLLLTALAYNEWFDCIIIVLLSPIIYSCYL